MQAIKKSLFLQVVIALILGWLFGFFFPQHAKEFQILGDAFVKFVKMLIAPLVFCVVVLGIYGAGDLKKAGKVGLKTIIYFEIMTTIALLLGLVAAYVFKPGAGMHIDVHSLDASSLSKYHENVHSITNLSDFFLNLILTSDVLVLPRSSPLKIDMFF